MSWKELPAPPCQNNSNDTIRQHQTFTNAAEPLIESGILQFTAASAMFTVHAGFLPDGYRKFPPSKTGSVRVTDQNGIWVGTVHAESGFGSSFGPSCVAEFLAFSIAHESYEKTNSPNLGQNSFDVDLLRKLDQKAWAPLLMNVMWRKMDGV